MSGFTPGPWVVDDMFTERGRITRVSATDGRSDYYLRCPSICECHVGDGVHVVQAEANARLIASAPALVEALEDLLAAERVLDDGDPELERSREAARAALRLARGEV